MLSGVSGPTFSPGIGGSKALSGPIAPSLSPPLGVQNVGEPATSDFASVLGQMAVDAFQTIKTSEQTAVAGIRGQASTQQVVEAMMAAEQTLQAGISIRDKVIASYLEISRMQI